MVTNPGGAGRWRDAHNDVFRGRRVVVLADDDEPGLRHAEQIAASLHGIAAQVRVVRPLTPKSAPKGEGYDVADWFEDKGTVADLEKLVAGTPPWSPGTDWGPTVPFHAQQEPGPFPLQTALPPMLAEVALAIAEHVRVDVTAPAARTAFPEDQYSILPRHHPTTQHVRTTGQTSHPLSALDP